MLTVGNLVKDCGLELAAGTDGAQGPIRWVHISELEDPTPWLSGGELLLTTGIQLTGAARQRRFLARLAERGVAGLGLGTDRAPATAEAARGRGHQARDAPVRGPVRDAVHRDHRACLRDPGQRAVCSPGARHPGARAPGATGDRGTRARGDPRLGRIGDRRVGGRPGRDRAGACSPAQQGRPRRRCPEGARRRDRDAPGDVRPDAVRAAAPVAGGAGAGGSRARTARRLPGRVVDRGQPADSAGQLRAPHRPAARWSSGSS